MLENYLVAHTSVPNYLLTTLFVVAGAVWGISLFLGWLAAQTLDGYPNHCSERQLFLMFTCLIIVVISQWMYFATIVGFYIPFFVFELGSGKVVPFGRLVVWIGTYNPYDEKNKDKRMPFAFYL